MGKKIKAVALFSGGLDSVLAIRVVQDLGIDVLGIYFSSPFWSSENKEKEFILKAVEKNNINIKIIPVDSDYIDMIKNPKYGRGKHLNPCIDCKIYMLKKAKKIMEEINGSFIISGEVLGQRPMSQHRNALNQIEKEAGVKGILLRPLSAKLLTPTESEKSGLIDRDKLFDISGRGRKRQLQLAEKLNIDSYTTPAGGCLLTEVKFADKLTDLFNHKNKVDFTDLNLLKTGRHYRFNNSKIIVGRNEKDNEEINRLKGSSDFIFEVPDIGSPLVILQEEKNDSAIKFAAELTAAYSDCMDEMINVRYIADNKEYSIKVKKLSKEEVNKYNITVS